MAPLLTLPRSMEFLGIRWHVPMVSRYWLRFRFCKCPLGSNSRLECWQKAVAGGLAAPVLLSLTEVVSEVAVSQDVFRAGGFHFAFFAELSNKNP
jgi:hypothetical protein